MSVFNLGSFFGTRKITIFSQRADANVRLDLTLVPGKEAFGVLIGLIDKGMVPTDDQCSVLLGQVGLVTMDDVDELLGPAARDNLMRRHTKKYSKVPPIGDEPPKGKTKARKKS